MSKAILVIDMPECCKNCMCYVLGAKNNFCEVTRLVIFDNTTKPSWCPLKPVPDKVGVFIDEWADGYNACLEEILGE